MFDVDPVEIVARIAARTSLPEFTTPEEARFGGQGPRPGALMANATTACHPVTRLSALEHQPNEIANAMGRFLKDSQ